MSSPMFAGHQSGVGEESLQGRVEGEGGVVDGVEVDGEDVSSGLCHQVAGRIVRQVQLARHHYQIHGQP